MLPLATTYQHIGAANVQCNAECPDHNPNPNLQSNPNLTLTLTLTLTPNPSYKASKFSFRTFSSRRSSLTQTFVKSCVDFEVAHLPVLMVQRLPYPEIPTLTYR